MRRNPLRYKIPSEQRFHGVHHSGGVFLDGVHVATDVRRAYAYAVSAFSRESEPTVISFAGIILKDYRKFYREAKNAPVVLELDVAGYNVIPDADGESWRISANDLRGEAAEYDSYDEAVEDAFWHDVDPTGDAMSDFLYELQPQPFPPFRSDEEWKAWSRGDIEIPDELVVEAVGQGRIMHDIPDSRICAVYLAHPIYRKYVLCEDELSELEKKTGWIFLSISEHASNLTWHDVLKEIYRSKRKCRDVMWHGTTILRLKEAAPSIYEAALKSPNFRFISTPTEAESAHDDFCNK